MGSYPSRSPQPGVEDAIVLAVAAHRGQSYPSNPPQPFILHPLRVMVQCATDEERIVAVLHDVIEDTSYTLEQLRIRGYSAAVLAALDCLTRRPDESYEVYIERIAINDLASRVKLADLVDNIRNNLQLAPTDETLRRIAHYRQAQHRLK
jgi:(p)ppGpp synthase/HD superfamily hydrolase